MEMKVIKALCPKPAPEPVGVVVPIEPEALLEESTHYEQLKKCRDGFGESISDQDLLYMLAALETLAKALPFGAYEFVEWAIECGGGWPNTDETVRRYAEEKLGMESLDAPVRARSRKAA